MYDLFTLAYIEAALWASCDDAGKPLDDYSFDDIAASSRATMIADCASFQAAYADLLTTADLTSEQAGHDFWLTRNRHGAGFWDRGLGNVGNQLTDAAHTFGECTLYVGDDNLIYSE